MDRATAVSQQRTARVAAAFYVGTIVFGALALGGWRALNLVAGACYIAVTLLFYVLFKPVSRSLSMLAATISLAGSALGILNTLRLVPFEVNELVFFGFYCLLIGLLIVRSTFLPPFLGALMAFGGVGWLTFLFPSFARSLVPYNMIPGILGEGVLTIWLLVRGVNVERWRAQAGAGP